MYIKEKYMAKKRQTNKKQIKRTVRRADKRKSASKDKRPPRSYGGVFQSSADGYGFITADDKDTFPADLFVPVKYVNGAVTSAVLSFTCTMDEKTIVYSGVINRRAE